MKRKRKSDPIKIEVIEGPEMTPDQFDAVVEILAGWIIKDFEKKRTEDRSVDQSGKGSQV